MSDNATEPVISSENAKTVQEFREFLDKWEQRNVDYIEKCKADEANGELPLGQYFLRGNRHEQLCDIKTAKELLDRFAEYSGDKFPR